MVCKEAGALKIIVNIFGDKPGLQRLTRACERSIRANCPDAQLEIVVTEPGPIVPNLPLHCSTNTHKLHYWRDRVHSEEGLLLFLDADTIVLRDLSVVFRRYDFDVAYTVRPSSIRYNAGVVFVRPNPWSRRFFDQWSQINDDLLANQPACLSGITQYGGINQAALHRVLNVPNLCKTQVLRCEVWNCTQELWHLFDSDRTAVLHVKSRLRELALGRIPETPQTLDCRSQFADYVYEQGLADVPKGATMRAALEAWRKYDNGEVT